MADKHPAHAQANTNLRAGSQSAVHALPPNAAGFHDVFGSVWQWCLDTFAALPGFKVHSMYDDFSTPCFDGQHSIIMGAPPQTPPPSGCSRQEDVLALHALCDPALGLLRTFVGFHDPCPDAC